MWLRSYIMSSGERERESFASCKHDLRLTAAIIIILSKHYSGAVNFCFDTFARAAVAAAAAAV